MQRNKHWPAMIGNLIEQGNIRRVEQEGRTLFVAADVVAALAETDYPQSYWEDLKQREPKLAGFAQELEWVNGQERQIVDGLDLEGVLRLAESVPSARAERIKAWLARAGLQRLQEIENPELAVIRSRKLYQQKGYSKRWIDKRLRGMSARQELTGEWYKRGASDSEEYRALTNELMQGMFDMDVESHRRYKHLARPGDNLRDHMNDLELVLTMLGETTAAALHRDRSSEGFEDLLRDVRDAGQIAATTRQEIEKQTGKPLVSPSRYVRFSTAGRPGADRPETQTNPDAEREVSRRVKIE